MRCCLFERDFVRNWSFGNGTKDEGGDYEHAAVSSAVVIGAYSVFLSSVQLALGSHLRERARVSDEELLGGSFAM